MMFQDGEDREVVDQWGRFIQVKWPKLDGQFRVVNNDNKLHSLYEFKQ